MDRSEPQRRLLVIGAPRSGTTLLATMIGRHTEIGMLNEDTTGKGVMRILGKKVAGNKLCIPNQIQLKRANRLAIPLFKKFGFIREFPKSRYSIEEYLRFSNLKIVAIVRNGDDTISSMMKRGGNNFRRSVWRWEQAVRTIYELRSSYPRRVLVVTFEDLVLTPETVMNTICRFLGLSFEKKMIDGYRYNPKYPGSKLDAEKVDRYKREGVDFQLSVKLPITYGKYKGLLIYTQQDKSTYGEVKKV